MPVLRVRGVQAYLVYEIDPPQEFVDHFTQRKLQHWPEINAPIDAYIGKRLEERIKKEKSRRRRLASAAFPAVRARAQSLIDTEVNRGLAVIAYNESFIIRNGSSESVVEMQAFELAMKRLMAEHGEPGKRLLRQRRRGARFWVDKCTKDLSDKFFDGFFASL